MPGTAGHLQKLGSGKEGLFPGAPEELVYKESLSLEQHPLLPFLSSPGCVRPTPVGSVSIFREYEAWAQMVVLAVFCYLNFATLKRELDLYLRPLDYILLLIHICIYPSNKYLLRT